MTLKAMQELARVDTPDSGVLLDGMVLPDGGRLSMGELMCSRVEAEIGFRFDRDLVGARVTARDVRNAVTEVMLALEVIDTRFEDWRIGLVDSIVDNASSARVVTGPAVAFAPGWDLAAERVGVSVDGVPVAEGPDQVRASRTLVRMF
ncbi:2-keto-4-pentenoate hydratase [Actinokineospora enzanensis]|uniref:2-keto-4-pentenoate hydratase n=1 Tax=Actinokineospora enzanensis TaxID=155975 RepID=UPI0012EC77E7|nr:hypothetical protein [Actinokineospora enzanensis]